MTDIKFMYFMMGASSALVLMWLILVAVIFYFDIKLSDFKR